MLPISECHYVRHTSRKHCDAAREPRESDLHAGTSALMPRIMSNDTGLPPITQLIGPHHQQSRPMRDSQAQPSGLLSPLSTMNSPIPSEWDMSSPTRLAECLGLKMVTCTDSERRPHHLLVPECATQGWFNKDNRFQKYVLQAFGHLDLPQLVSAWFTRGEHPDYGEDHVSTRNKKPMSASFNEDDDSSVKSFSKQHEGHKEKERERRDRHRVLQKEVHDCTSDVVFRLAEEKLPALKKDIVEMPKPDPNFSQVRKSKNTGKDEQLAAAAFLPHLSNVVIFRLLDALAEAEKDAAILRRNLRHEQETNKRLENKFIHIERQFRQSIEPHHVGLRSAIDLGSHRYSLSPQDTRRHKRSFDEVDEAHRGQCQDQRPVKRPHQQQKHFGASLDTSLNISQSPYRPALPPSPSSTSPRSTNSSFGIY